MIGHGHNVTVWVSEERKKGVVGEEVSIDQFKKENYNNIRSLNRVSCCVVVAPLP